MNFWSRFVFGFLLAQVLPGVLGTFFVSFLSGATKIFESYRIEYKGPGGFTDYIGVHAARLVEKPGFLGVFAIVSICSGIVLYWFNWLLLARLEQQAEASDLGGLENLKCHKRPPLVQIFVWPLDVLGEVFVLFFGTPSFDKMIRKERMTQVPPEKFTQLSWIEDYYLPFALFLSNMQFALLPALFSILLVFFDSGFTWRRFLILVAVYFLIGLIRLLARQQLISLGRAERDLLRGASEG